MKYLISFLSKIKRLRVVFHDLKAEILKLAAIGRPDIILHLAAASHVDRSISFHEFVQDNVVGTVNLLDFARRLPKLEKFVYFSTDEIFGNALKEYHIVSMIDTILQIHIVQVRPLQRNFVLL